MGMMAAGGRRPPGFRLAGRERPGFRNYLGDVCATQRAMNYSELAQGDHSRSGGQYDIWQAVVSPVGVDGYPTAPVGADLKSWRY